jgi:peptidoglycan-associated lipoprotein
MTIINARTILASLISVSLAACGSKAKPPVTTTDNTPTDTKRPPAEKPAETPAPEKTNEDLPTAASLAEIIYFDFDSTELNAEARAELEQNAEWLKQDPARTLTIEGHTDEVGTNEYNLGLGERRARASMDYLLRLGVDAKRVSVITYGEEKPASPEDAKNRRSVFVATKK